ncbi:MAG TPA: 2-dehydropantoate 2-reductase [Levilinea sp.]|nr:2-dehydropantoate 2-reductase [Levilinea sp.]
MRFLVLGAGAIGVYIGGSLALTGQKAVFVERPALVNTLRANGLRLKLRTGEYHIREPLVVSGVDEALTLGPFDAAILAVKSFDTRLLLESLAPYLAALPPLICLQNGVENEPLLAEVLGEEKVIAATVTSAIGRRGPGDIVLERLRGVGIAAGHTLSPALEAVFSSAGLGARLYDQPLGMKWSKMLTNLLANASSAILDMPPAKIFAHPGLFDMEMKQLRECLRVMKVLRIPVVDLPGTPVRLLAWFAGSLPPVASQPLMLQSLGRSRGDKMPSFHIDLHSGRGLSEVDYLNGAVVRFGERWRVPAPVNYYLNETLLALTAGTLPLDLFAHRPEKLLRAVAGAKEVHTTYINNGAKN